MNKEQVAHKLTATNKTVQHDRDDAGERLQHDDSKPTSDGGIMKKIQSYSWYLQKLLWSKTNWINRKLS